VRPSQGEVEAESQALDQDESQATAKVALRVGALCLRRKLVRPRLSGVRGILREAKEKLNPTRDGNRDRFSFCTL